MRGKSGCELVTLFDSYCDDGVRAALGVQHTVAKSGFNLVSLFDSDCDDCLSAVTKVIHKIPPEKFTT